MSEGHKINANTAWGILILEQLIVHHISGIHIEQGTCGFIC